MFDSFTSINTDNAQLDNLKKFNTYFINRYFDPFIKGYAFIFVTRPSLFIYPVKDNSNQTDSYYKNLAFDNVCRDPFFSKFLTGESMNEQDSIIFKQLSFAKMNEDGVSNNFIPAFTNMIENFETQDIVMDAQDGYETKQGYRMQLPTFKTQSEGAGQITFSMKDSSNLDITNMIGIWVNYISNITDGTFSANPMNIKARIIDYMSSIYYFVFSPDGKTLKYWSKYTGCWPTNIPYSSLSYAKGQTDSTEISVTFNYNSKEDMNPQILEDFNRVSLGIESEMLVEDGTKEFFSSMNSNYLNKSIVIEKYKEEYPRGGINPVIISEDNSSTQSSISGSLYNRFKLLFPVDIDNLYTSIKFQDNEYYGNNLFSTALDY